MKPLESSNILLKKQVIGERDRFWPLQGPPFSPSVDRSVLRPHHIGWGSGEQDAIGAAMENRRNAHLPLAGMADHPASNLDKPVDDRVDGWLDVLAPRLCNPDHVEQLRLCERSQLAQSVTPSWRRLHGGYDMNMLNI